MLILLVVRRVLWIVFYIFSLYEYCKSKQITYSNGKCFFTLSVAKPVQVLSIASLHYGLSAIH
jgi:hypothetical protein